MRKRTRRKVYEVLVDTMKVAAQGAAIAAPDVLDRLRMLELQAIDAFAHGRATQDDWRAVADICNLSQTMCDLGIGPEVLPVALEVESVLGEAHMRYTATGKIGTTGPGLKAMRDLQEWHHLQRTSVARSVYERVIQRTANRIRSAAPDVKVLIG